MRPLWNNSTHQSLLVQNAHGGDKTAQNALCKPQNTIAKPGMIELTDEILGAYLDGALSPADHEAVAHALSVSPENQTRLAAMRDADHIVRQAHPAPVTRLDDPVARKIRETRPGSRVRQVVRLPAVATLSALAAGLVGLVIGQLLPTPAPDQTTTDFAATGALARALDSQPSGDTSSDVRILLSFKAADATPCRQFSVASAGHSGEGVACRDAETWRVVAWVQTPTSPDASYRAAGADGVIDGVVDTIDATGALSVADERALLSARWR